MVFGISLWRRSSASCVSSLWLRQHDRTATTQSFWRSGSEPRWKSPKEIRVERIAAMRSQSAKSRAS